jgi:2-methylcitrate dehydratase PrpD
MKQRELARFAVDLDYEHLPPVVVEKAKEIALHTWGVQLAASTVPWSRAVFRYVRNQGGTSESTVVNYGFRTSAINATFANSSFGYGFEMDDNFARAGIKGGCLVVPPALAVGEQQRSSGREMIAAIAAGFEIMLRVALTVRDFRRKSGFSGTGNVGAFGGAVASGKLLGLDEESMVHAIGGAAFNHSGLPEAPEDGRGHLKRTFAGMAASAGVRAALLAREGLTGPESAVDGVRGFCRVFGGPDADFETLTAGLGSEWLILDVHYKLYAQDGFIQPMTQALATIRKKHSFETNEIDEVLIGTNSRAHDFTVGVIREPKDITSAQYSANFSVALFLVTGGAGFQEYTESNLSKAEVIDLSRRVHLVIDDEIEADWLRRQPRGAKVTVRLKSGMEFREHVPNLRLMNSDEVDDKFRRLASVVLAEDHYNEIVARTRHLEDTTDVSDMAGLLVAQ